MGYTTEFTGKFKLNKALTLPQYNYLKAFNDTRRMKRHAIKAAAMLDTARIAVGLPIGQEGGYYVGGEENESSCSSVLDYNSPPISQPGLWCGWTPTKDGMAIEWDGSEKFYEYVRWIQYLITHFLEPWGIAINGHVEWQGEDAADQGVITATNNVIATNKLVKVKEVKEDTSGMIQTVMVLEMNQGCIVQAIAFPETEEGNERARKLFERIAVANGCHETDIDDCYNDGQFIRGMGYHLMLIHSA